MSDEKRKNIVVRISSNTMGRGDDSLGKRLLNTFCGVLPEVDDIPSAIVFFNTGVYLTCEGSEALDALQELEKRGTIILNCGTCLNHFNLNNKLKVGIESNMFNITKTMMNADLVIPL